MSSSDEQPSYVRVRRAGLAKIRRRSGGGMGLDRPVAEQREAFSQLLALTQVAMPEHRFAAAELAGVECLRLTPSELTSERQILFVHGGGYSLGSPLTHRPLVARVARRVGAEALMPRYRLAPEHPCPAALDDVRAVWRALPDAVRAKAILAGDSAGGGLALALAMRLRDEGELLPAGVVLLSPWTDLTMSGDSIEAHAAHEVMLGRRGLELMAGRYAGELPRDDPRVSPLFGRFEGLPPTLIQVGGVEVLLDDARRAAARAAEAGVAVELQIYEGQGHVFQATPIIDAAAAAIRAVAAWVAQLD
ncbi:Monoterpene epsilon-lactone hydrolase [Enhygromyxa salina]|uniref:Monoterpene epsilon-lactone hydrolase n=1 Tax=Enhygromyxa salina TaxID=215803 RepID=A0A2S9XEW1_9BACT|nr:alpha/beta hydrolase [Enhygromyxa salina]PRP91211.1 Monoterpene epsilon-lactone hydrolase [Enhygromyxa salina]